jgi:predicted small integral membrane protein
MSVQSPRRKSLNILLITVLILQSGCRGWIEKPIVPDTGIAIPRRGLVRVTKSDRTVITLTDSFITNDSIVGFASDTSSAPTAIARTDVTKIEVRGDTIPQGIRTSGKIYLIWVEVVGAVGMTLIAIVL